MKIVIALFGFFLCGRPAFSEDLNRSLEFAQVLYVLSRSTHEQQIRLIPRWLEQNFRYRPACDRAWLGGVGEAQCLLGMRSLMRALAYGAGPKPQEIIDIHISKDSKWKGFEAVPRQASLTLPYFATPAEMIKFLDAEFQRPAYRRRLGLLMLIEQSISSIENLTSMTVEVDDEIDNELAANGLYRLLLLAREDYRLFAGPSEAIRVSNSFRLPYERNLKLKEDIDAREDANGLRDYLRDTARKSGHWTNQPSWPDRFFAQRALLNESKRKLQEEARIETVECLSSGAMKQRLCLRVLDRFRGDLKLITTELPHADLLVVVDVGGMPEMIDYYIDKATNRAVLLVRSDFSFEKFIQYFSERQWRRAL